MRSPEPEIVTLAKMVDDNAARIAEGEKALADVNAEIGSALLDAERGGDDEAVKGALKRLAAAERRRDDKLGKQERLRLKAVELERQLAAERDKEAARERREMLADYMRRHDAMQEANRAMLAAVMSIGELAREANEHSRVTAKQALALGLPDERRGRHFGAQYGALKNVLNGLLTGHTRMVREARADIERDWRTTPNGRRALELQAALDRPDDGE